MNYSNTMTHRNAIPYLMRFRRQWVLWRFESRNAAKLAKPPLNPRTGEKALVSDPTTWGTFGQVSWSLQDFECEGLGFVFTEQDPLCGIDLDDCRNPETGEIALWAHHLVKLFASYSEISPSGTGLHIYAEGRLPGKGLNKKPLEIYDRDRYFTFTGQHIPETPSTIGERQSLIDLLYNAAPIMAMLLCNRKKHEKFERLFVGDIKAYEHDDSSADIALCNMAAHAGASAKQIDAVMCLSGLHREKWERQDYRERTIAEALKGRQSVPPPRERKQHTYAEANFQPTPLADLFSEPDEQARWLVEGLLPAGGLSMVAAKPKVGKSTLARNLAVAVARGTDFCERQVYSGPVLYVALEEKRSEVRKHFAEMGASGTEQIHLADILPLTDRHEWLQVQMERIKPSLVIIDPIFLFTHLRDVNNYMEVTQALSSLRQLARKADVQASIMGSATLGFSRWT